MTSDARANAIEILERTVLPEIEAHVAYELHNMNINPTNAGHELEAERFSKLAKALRKAISLLTSERDA